MLTMLPYYCELLTFHLLFHSQPPTLPTTCYILRVLLLYQNFFLRSAFLILHYLIHDAEDNGVDKTYSSHSHQAQQEEVGITVQLEVGGLWVKDGAHKLAFGCAETWVNKL